MYGHRHPTGPCGARPHRAPVAPAVVAQRIVASIMEHRALGVERDVSLYTSRPETVALVQAALASQPPGH
jgi:hypothetical protein